MKKLICFLFATILLLLISSCRDEEPTLSTSQKAQEAGSVKTLKVEPNIEKDSAKSMLQKKISVWPNEVYDSTYGLIKIDDNTITTQGVPCGIKYMYGWIFDHYEPMPGRSLGIWPKLDRYDSQEKLNELRNIYGFTFILYTMVGYSYPGGPYDMAVAAGLTPIVGVARNNYTLALQNWPNAYGYHVDEGIERWGWSASELINFSNSLNSSAILTLGSYTTNLSIRGQYSNVLLNTSNTYMMCTSYSGDQRDTWTLFNNNYTRGFSHFINVELDYSEFNQLFGHANNLGIINTLWLYSPAASYPQVDNNMGVFCAIAWNNGWLIRVERYCEIEYHCDRGCNCESNIPDDWYIYKIRPLEIFREVYP